ncbi:MAG TPA: aminoglycoside phosphotransferase family protein, partial [Candidatus Acidoferrales bacterium]|nr:aminoglycoside phosphotransferase family protein [Candidatus Acidoferrales bacterium]
IRYRPGRRHVLRYDPIDDTERGTVFAKAYAGDNAERSYRVAKSVAAWLKLNGKGVTSLEPLAYLPEDSVVVYPRLLGESLSQYLQRPHADKGQKLKSIGVALRAIHDLPPQVIGSLKPHDLIAEIKQINRSIFHLPTLLPAAGSIVAAMLERAKEINEKLPGESPVFTHGDFISEHIWATPNGLVLIDFDNCFLADPALDLGKLLADLQLLFANHNLNGVEEAQEAFLADYCPGTPPERLVRARLYEAIKLAKMAGRRVYVFEPDWARRTEKLIDRAQALMNDLENKLGLRKRPGPIGGYVGGFEEGTQIV